MVCGRPYCVLVFLRHCTLPRHIRITNYNKNRLLGIRVYTGYHKTVAIEDTFNQRNVMMLISMYSYIT